MKRSCIFLLAAMCILLMPGCYDQMNLEDASITLMLGLDLDEKNNLVVYTQSPVFYKEAKEKTEKTAVKAVSIRKSRQKLDAILTGLTIGGKNQSVLISKRLLQQKEWYRLFDLFYREPKQPVSSRVIIVDGPVEEVFNFKPKDKPRLAMHMRKLIDTANKRNVTVITNLQELRRQMKDKGITPSITEIKKDVEQIKVTGTDLLNKQGEYAGHLSLDESMYLLVLQNQMNGELSFSIPVAETSNGEDNNNRMVSFNAVNVKKKVIVAYSENTFQYDINIKIPIEMTSIEGDNNFDMKEHKTQLENQITKELQKQFDSLIKKCQENQVDPFGFGLYARAYQSSAWKVVQNEWGKSFSKAKVRVTPQVKIKSFGVTE
ncbi:germination protein, Ger(x)C family [Paenibacillus sp. yr247]|uniref:Ger(x)C family spore germination protein n=1 Tax=Paenibacillus sp. yr247 TaxID=1761880 RepID=UPI000880B7EA|nr:Ger(x)C family spore germination protein [Paenibacillus sp. yr247]SDO71955.1 germination protein, Ger(x)C family [Paenibacillus sp. yr247]